MAGKSSWEDFRGWLVEKGGDDNLIHFLLQRGFTSKLSLQYLNLECKEGQELLNELSLGQRCLLIGVINGLQADSGSLAGSSISADVCRSAINQAQSLASRAKDRCSGKDSSIKSKINRLFNFHSTGSNLGKASGKAAAKKDSSHKKRLRTVDSASSDSDSCSSDFLPGRSHAGPKGKGRLGGKSNESFKNVGKGVKRKIKEIRFRVVWVYPGATNTPRDRRDRTKDVWIRSDASAETVRKRIIEEMDWQHTQEFEYMYARGKSLRIAKLSDIENSIEWDCDTLKALTGSGCLYVSKSVPAPDPTDCGEGVNSQATTQGQGDADLTFLKEGFPDKDDDYGKEISGTQGHCDADLEFLKEVFPEKGDDELIEVLEVYGISSEGIDALLLSDSGSVAVSKQVDNSDQPKVDNSDGSGSSCNDPVVLDEPSSSVMTAGKLVVSHADRMIDITTEYSIFVDRTSPSGMWDSMLGFYKKAKKDPGLLCKQLVVHFAGESGVDTGALRREFLEDSIKEMNAQLFDGSVNNRVPKKDWNLEFLFEVFGMLISHSVLQSGPSFPCLNAAVYTYIVSGNPAFCFPKKNDIPLDLGTESLIKFITKLENAELDEDIGVIVDEPANLAILNASSWSIIDPINSTNKHSLIQRLVEEEVIVKRERNLKAFRQGLQAMDFLGLITNYPLLMKPFFVAEEETKPLTDDEFFSLMKTPNTTTLTAEESQAWDFFQQFITYLQGHDTLKVNSVLRFCTGLSSVPPLGLEQKISVSYIPGPLPKTQACFGRLKLPTVHSSFDEFCKAFCVALNYGGSGYGCV